MRLILFFWTALQFAAIVTARFHLALTQSERNLHLLTTGLTVLALLYLQSSRHMPRQRQLHATLGIFLIGMLIEGGMVITKAFAAVWSSQLAIFVVALAVTGYIAVRELLADPEPLI